MGNSAFPTFVLRVFVAAIALVVPLSPVAAQIEVIPESELSPGARFAVAIEDGDVEKVRGYLDAGVPADTRIDYGEHFETPLMKAARSGEDEIVRLLLERGAKVDTKDESGSTALNSAVDRGNLSTVKILLAAKIDPNTVNQYMQSPLANAVAAGNVEITEALLGAKAKQELPGLSLTPMMFAVFAGNADLVRLLARNGGDVNYATSFGQTALSSAITAGKPEMVRLLIDLKANVNQKSPDGDTPLKMARNGDQDDVVAMLVAAGAKE